MPQAMTGESRPVRRDTQVPQPSRSCIRVGGLRIFTDRAGPSWLFQVRRNADLTSLQIWADLGNVPTPSNPGETW